MASPVTLTFFVVEAEVTDELLGKNEKLRRA